MNSEMDNQFSVGDISDISRSRQIVNDTHNNEAQQQVLALLRNSKNSNMNGQIDERIANKIKYLNSLNHNNQEMKNKIKEINQKLSSEVSKISTSMVHHPVKNKPKILVERSPQVEVKYAELDALKKQINYRISQKNALATLEQKLSNLKAQYKTKYEQLQQKQYKIAKLKAILQKKLNQEENNHKNDPPNSSYNAQAIELKEKIKREAKRVYTKKSEFIQNNRSVRKMRELERAKNNNSTIQIGNKGVIGNDNDLSEQAQQLKREYEIIGKRIELLKMQKLALTIEDSSIDDKKRKLERLKRKYVQICKL